MARRGSPARRMNEPRLRPWLMAGATLHGVGFIAATVVVGAHSAAHHTPASSLAFSHGRHQATTAETEVELWDSKPHITRPVAALEIVPFESHPKPLPTRAVHDDSITEVAIGAGDDAFVDELNRVAVATPAAEPASSRLPLDLGLSGTSYLIVGPELQRGTQHDRYRNAETKLNQYLARETLQSDSLTLYSLESAARRELLEVARILPLHASRVVVRFAVTTDGTIDAVEVLTRGALEPPLVRTLIAQLGSRTIARKPSSAVEYTFELSDSTRTASGRTAGTRLSIGGVGIGQAEAPDSPSVEIVPPKWRFERARKLSRDGKEHEQDPERPIHIEQRLFDTGVDPTDILGDARRELRARLLASKVL